MWFATPLRKLHGGFPTFCKVGRVIFAIRYRLTQEWGYEPDEYSQLMVLLDERPLPGGAVDYFARIRGRWGYRVGKVDGLEHLLIER